MKLTRSLGMLALGIYLILVGLAGIGVVAAAGLGTVAAMIAIAAGVLILLGR